jgi:acetyl esterase/lipase
VRGLVAALLVGIATVATTMAAAAPALMTWSDLVGRPLPAADRRIAYGPDPLQHVELWLPRGAARPVPTVLMIHGGCWQTDVAEAKLMNYIADNLRTRGIAVWNIEYRGVDRPGGGYPGTFRDAAAAADLLARDGPALGLDTGHVVAVGHSAGGHLAMWLAARPRLPRASVLWNARPLPIAAVLSQGGLPDLPLAKSDAAEACGADTVDRLVGGPTPGHSDPYADTSPDRMLPIGVPQVLVNGGSDHIAPPRFAAAWVVKAKAAGDPVSSVVVPDQGHVELIAPGTPAWMQEVAVIGQLLHRGGR